MRDNLILNTRKYFTEVQKLLYRIFARSYSLLVTFEALLYVLRTGRPWTIGIFTDLFFSTEAFQQNSGNLLSLITEEKQFCQPWEQTQQTLLQQSRRTACGTTARDFSEHQQQLWLLGLPQPLLKSCTHLWARGSEPHKMRFQILQWETHPFFFHRGKKDLCLSIPPQGKDNMERGELPTRVGKLSSHLLQSFTGYNLLQTAGLLLLQWFDSFIKSSIVSWAHLTIMMI